MSPTSRGFPELPEGKFSKMFLLNSKLLQKFFKKTRKLTVHLATSTSTLIASTNAAKS